MGEPGYVRLFDELGHNDVAEVGGKNASLGEMYNALKGAGVAVPWGFAVTAAAYRDALSAAGAWEKLHAELDGLDKRDVRALGQAGQRCRELVYAAGLPEAAEAEIRAGWRRLVEAYGPEVSVAVRSSATAEDLPTASFAGQHESYLNVAGEESLVDAVKRCQASLFTDRAIGYRIDKGFDHFKIGLSACVQKMVRSDLASAGVAFTLDTETGFRDVVFVTGAYGLGENVVQGNVDVDEFYVHKPTFRQGYRRVLRRRLGAKQVRLVYAGGGKRDSTVNRPTPEAERAVYCLSDGEVAQLADYALQIEDHYSETAGQPQPMDIEWAKDGLDGRLYIVQARPETVAAQIAPGQVASDRLTESPAQAGARALASGRAVGTHIRSGKARVITNPGDLGRFRPGEVLVADSTAPDWEPVMKTASAIVTDRGGRTCHAAIVARELDIPAIVGAGAATQAVPDGTEVSVVCAEGDTGTVYDRKLAYASDSLDVTRLERPQTKLKINLGNPDIAFSVARLPHDGVGLARMEFIINEYIRAHPMALCYSEKLDAATRRRLAELTAGFADGPSFFVDRLAEGVGTIAAAIWPQPVLLRLSDFKTNEYAALLGGAAFEPEEANPMLGFRGAARYAHPAYRDGFALECQAIRRVREGLGLTNLHIMVPFVRRLAEARSVLAALSEHGLIRGRAGLEVHVMCEIPNNVVLFDDFAELFDGFSIGSNDLTQLYLGVDRDSNLVANDFDERDPGLYRVLHEIVAGGKRTGRPVGICGQAPSDYPELARDLVARGIDSLSLSPDSLVPTLRTIRELEAEQGWAPRG